MNIFYCDRFQPGSTSSTHVYELLTNLRKLGHQVVVLDGGSSMLRQTSGAAFRPTLPSRLRKRLMASWLYKAFRGEILIGWLFFLEARVFVSALLLMSRKRKEIDVIYRRHNLVNSEYLLSRLFRVPNVTEVNGLVADEARISKQGDRLSLAILDAIETRNMLRADKIIVVTSKLAEVLRDDYHVPSDKITVIWNGADTSLFKPMEASKARRELGLDTDCKYVCFVGSLSRWQGVEHLVKAAPVVLSRDPGVRFMIVGDGLLKGELVELVQKSGVGGHFLFVGFVPYEKVPLYIGASNICVAPFVATRNERIGVSPLKLCEYMACERPVVTSRIPGLEVVETQSAGILVAPENPEELADAIVRLLGARELSVTMGQNGRRYAVQERSWESVARSVAAVCQQAMDDHRRDRD